MGKARKARAPRSLPYARPEATMEIDDAAPPTDARGKPLSAHKQKVIERKRLQAQIQEVALHRRKIKGGDKKVVKAAKKQLSKQIKDSKQQRATLQSFVEAHRAHADAAEPEPQPSPTGFHFQFSLPVTNPIAVDREFWPAR
jgi:hypothetical protein